MSEETPEIIAKDGVKRGYQVLMDKNGFPVLLADVPNAGVSTQRKTGSKGGNPRHDIRSGKFAPAPGGPSRVEPPANVDPMEFRRYMDAIRDAAREFDDPDIGDIQEFIAGRAQSPDKVDAAQFLEAVREQRKSDLLDLIDQQMRSSGILPRGRRRVRVSAPRGFLRRALGNIDEDVQAELMVRLEARGHDREEVEKFFRTRTKNGDVRERRDSLAASNEWQAEFLSPEIYGDFDELEERSEQFVELANIFKNLPQPVVKVEPHIFVEAPKPTRKEIIRDEETGLAVGVREVPEDGPED